MDPRKKQDRAAYSSIITTHEKASLHTPLALLPRNGNGLLCRKKSDVVLSVFPSLHHSLWTSCMNIYSIMNIYNTRKYVYLLSLVYSSLLPFYLGLAFPNPRSYFLSLPTLIFFSDYLSIHILRCLAFGPIMASSYTRSLSQASLSLPPSVSPASLFSFPLSLSIFSSVFSLGALSNPTKWKNL